MAPSPAEVDRAAKQYLDLKDKFLQAKLAASEIELQMGAKGELLRQLASDFGSAHSEKSKLLHGLGYEIIVSFGQTVTIDAAAVENFRQALVKADQPRLLTKLFDKTIRWTLNPEASKIVRGLKLSEKLLSLFAKCGSGEGDDAELDREGEAQGGGSVITADVQELLAEMIMRHEPCDNPECLCR